MADFIQTMRDWKRMCKAMGQEDEYNACDKCKLRSFECPPIYERECDDADWGMVEKVVTAWAAEHKEPVYPTWIDWLVDQGLIFVTSNTYAFNFLKATDPIPADIAEKLGDKAEGGRMTYGEIYERAVGLIGLDNMSDYRPAVYEGMLNGMFDFPNKTCVPNAIMIWLKNGDRIIYRAVEPKEG